MAVEYGFTITDVLRLENSSAKGLTSATMEDGVSISFASLAEMRRHIAWMREKLGADAITSSGFVSINANTDTGT